MLCNFVITVDFITFAKPEQKELSLNLNHEKLGGLVDLYNRVLLNWFCALGLGSTTDLNLTD